MNWLLMMVGKGRKEGAYGEKICRFSRAVHLVASDVFGIGRTPCSGVITASRMLDFDNFCSANLPRSRQRCRSVQVSTSWDAIAYWTRRAYPRSPRICVQYGWNECQSLQTRMRGRRHTPANTLVMSSTRIPARGNVGLAVVDASVAMKRHLDITEPLSRTRQQRGRASPNRALGNAILAQIVIRNALRRKEMDVRVSAKHLGYGQKKTGNAMPRLMTLSYLAIE